MKFAAAAISESGPRKTNEDEATFWRSAGGDLFAAVADGLGGMGGGANASRIAIDTLHKLLDLDAAGLPDLKALTRAAHVEILRAQESSADLRRMATTLTGALFTQHGLFGVHCGDSRASIARGSGIVRLTSDQSEGERLFRAGKLTKEELRDYARKNILDSALGVHEEPQIETFNFALSPGDKVFFTTDGVHGKILLREMRDIAERHSSPDTFVREVGSLVSSRIPEDNYSIVAVFVE